MIKVGCMKVNCFYLDMKHDYLINSKHFAYFFWTLADMDGHNPSSTRTTLRVDFRPPPRSAFLIHYGGHGLWTDENPLFCTIAVEFNEFHC